MVADSRLADSSFADSRFADSRFADSRFCRFPFCRLSFRRFPFRRFPASRFPYRRLCPARRFRFVDQFPVHRLPFRLVPCTPAGASGDELSTAADALVGGFGCTAPNVIPISSRSPRNVCRQVFLGLPLLLLPIFGSSFTSCVSVTCACILVFLGFSDCYSDCFAYIIFRRII